MNSFPHYIAHRINTIAALAALPITYGVEIDIRSRGSDLILQHDPYQLGERLEDYLSHYHHGTLILNIKEEALEYQVLELLKQYNIHNYFFLDSSFPMIYKLIMQGEKRVALRFSEFEGMDTLIHMAGHVEWVWVDTFTRLPIDKDSYQKIKELAYKLCLVSPELQNQAEKIPVYRQYLQQQDIHFDAICTKAHNIALWQP